MEDSNAALRVDGRDLHQVLLSSTPVLIETVLAELRIALPVYDSLPAEVVQSEVGPLIGESIKLFAETLRLRRLPDAAAFSPLEKGASRRAEETIPLQDLLTAYHLGCSVARDYLTTDATAADLADIDVMDRLLLAFLARTSTAVSTGYLRMSRDTAQEHQVARRALLDSLLEGSPSDALAARLNYTLPLRFAILALAIGQHPDESAPKVDQAVVTTRKLRRLRHDLDNAAPDALSVMTPEVGTVLLPLPEGDFGVDGLRGLVAQLTRAAGAPILAALATAKTADVPTGVQLAREVLEVAGRSGRTDGLVRLEDQLVEYQLSRPSAATVPLAGLLTPVATHPNLIATLRTFLLEEGLNRRRTAAALHVHPHTVDYRLKRVTALTGLDPVDASDAQRLLAAFIAHELVRESMH